MCTYRKVGTFVRLTSRTWSGLKKSGGNVAAYVCTPAGRVLHIIPGSVSGEHLAREVAWVSSRWYAARLAAQGIPGLAFTLLRLAHRERERPLWMHLLWLGQRRYEPFDHLEWARIEAAIGLAFQHRHVSSTLYRGFEHALAAGRWQWVCFPYLASHAGERLKRLYPRVWVDIVGQPLSNDPVRTEDADRASGS